MQEMYLFNGALKQTAFLSLYSWPRQVQFLKTSSFLQDDNIHADDKQFVSEVSERKELNEPLTGPWYAVLKGLPFTLTPLRSYIGNCKRSIFLVALWFSEEQNGIWNVECKPQLKWHLSIKQAHLFFVTGKLDICLQLWLLTVSYLAKTWHTCNGMSVFLSSLEMPTFPSSNFFAWVSLQVNLCLVSNQI